MKKVTQISIAIFSFTFLLIACKKETGNESTENSSTNTSGAANRIVPLCGRKFNSVDPPTGTWAMAIKVNNVIKKIGIPNRGEVSFTNIDWVKFEFSGQYADANNTIKLYRVRRSSDNLYLTFEIGLAYVESTAANSHIQLWAFEGMSDNSYRLTIPKFSSNCIFAHTFPLNGGYRIGGTWIEGSDADSNFSFFLSPVSSLPPNTN